MKQNQPRSAVEKMFDAAEKLVEETTENFSSHNLNIAGMFAQMADTPYVCTEQHLEYPALIMLDEDENGNICLSINPDDPTLQGFVIPFCVRTKFKMSDNGTAYVTGSRTKRSQATPIKVVDHGRLSHTIDNCVQLTVKYPLNEGIDIRSAFAADVLAANAALNNWIDNRQSDANPLNIGEK